MSGKNNNNKAAEAAALLIKKKEEANFLLVEKQGVLDNLPETATEEEKATALKEVEDAQKALDLLDVKKPNTSKKIKVTALVNLSGTFGLAWSEGQSFECDEKQANEMLEVGAVKLSKK